MAKRYSDFDEDDQDGFFDQILTIISHKKREFAIVSVLAAIVLLGLVVWGSYPENEDAAANQSVPIIRADAGAYKTAPDNPGGMEIPYRDSTVFAAAGNGGPENILADDAAEEPVPRSQLFAGLNTDGDQPGGAPLSEIEEAQKFAKAEPVEPPVQSGLTSADPLVKEAIGGAPQMSAAPAPKQEVAIEAPKAAPVEKQITSAKDAAKIESAAGAAATAKAVQPGGYYIQLASVRSTAGVEGEWKKLQAKYGSLGALRYRTQQANLGDKGIFHRIQAGPVSKDDATRICNEIKKTTPGGCLVVSQ
ncbi:MAG: SPOR domain-containing protein [Micavibrio sp.]